MKKLPETKQVAEITRRDFVGNTLIGAGVALLTMAAPAVVRPALAQTIDLPLNDLPPDWSGPSGIGDYAGKNGNTASVVNAGHGLVRDGLLLKRIQEAQPVDDLYDLIIVGSGISGLTSAYVYQKAKPNARILILDQHAIFGGEAKLNQFEVDGVLLQGPQGSTVANLFPDYPFMKELQFDKPPPFTKPRNTRLSIPWNSWGAMLWTQSIFDQAYYIEAKGMVRNPWRNNLANVPFPDKVKKAIVQVIEYQHPEEVKDADAILDSMTYKEFLLKYVKVPAESIAEVCAFFDQAFAAAGCYRSAWMSAYSANFLALPGVVNFGNPTPFFYNQPIDKLSDEFKNIVRSGQFPGGNAHIARRFLKLGKPEAIRGEYNYADVEYGRVNWEKLDLPGDRYRLRLSSTVFSVAHNDQPERATNVVVTYAKGAKMYAV
jgi:spermidine dehydrogenase